MLLGACLSCLHSMKPLWSYQRKKAIQLKSGTIIKVVEQKLLGEHLIMLLWGKSLYILYLIYGAYVSSCWQHYLTQDTNQLARLSSQTTHLRMR